MSGFCAFVHQSLGWPRGDIRQSSFPRQLRKTRCQGERAARMLKEAVEAKGIAVRLEAQTARMCLLAHKILYDACSSTITVRWLVRFKIGVECICARIIERFQVGPVSASARLTYSRSSSTFC